MALYVGGTGDANKLDDYEEGTWTPNPHGYWSGGWRQATYTGTVEGATYTKIGRTVYFKCYFNNVDYIGGIDVRVAQLIGSYNSSIVGIKSELPKISSMLKVLFESMR